MTAYYNEINPYAAEWLRNLIAAGHIAPGDVDTRSIEDVVPADLAGYTQCHFFAGIGVWSYALRLAGWPDDRPVWTGSCPCQPFSTAGKGGRFDDERHLWPVLYHLIRVRRPPVFFGEQVTSKDGLAWLDLVQADLEAEGYACGAVDLCAAGVGAPHIRQRQWIVAERLADAELSGATRQRGDGWRRAAPKGLWSGPSDSVQFDGMADAKGEPGRAGLRDIGASGLRLAIPGYDRATRELAHSNAPGLSVRQPEDLRGTGRREEGRATEQCRGASGGVAHGARSGRGEKRTLANGLSGRDGAEGLAPGFGSSSGDLRPCPTGGFWRSADWLHCRDGKWRPVEPGTFPLAHGAPARVGRLRAYGNAIVAPAAQAFIEAYLETDADRHLRMTQVSEKTNDTSTQDIFGRAPWNAFTSSTTPR